MEAKLNKKKRKDGFRLATLGGCFALLVVVLGAFTRLVDAGLGCPDWPGCYGELLWPNEAHEFAQAEEAFPDAPVDSSKTWPEMVHRYLAGALGLMILGLAWFGWRNRETPSYPFRLPIFVLFLVVWQAMFGMWTVTLKLWPQVVTVHLLGGMSIFCLLWVLALRLGDRPWQLREIDWRRLKAVMPWSVVGIAIVFCQVILGGWTSSNYAAFACPDFPQCQSSWWPANADFQAGFNIFQQIGPNYLGGLMENDARVAIHLAHRLGAVITAIYLFGYIVSLLRLSAQIPALKQPATVILLLLIGQLALGISNIVFMVPLAIAVAHNAVAALLLLSLVLVATRIWMSQPTADNK